MNKHYAYSSPFKMKDEDGNEYTLTVEYDDYAENPREWDNLCTMVCWHSRYKLGDEHCYDDVDEFFNSILHDMCEMEYDDLIDMDKDEKYKLIFESGQLVIKPINLYDHGSITVSTSDAYPYNDRWDSCCVGFIYVTKEKIFTDYKNATEDNWKEIACGLIEAEMEIYDMYVRGEVYWYRLTQKVIEQDTCPHCGEVIREYEDEEEVDACGGFYGDFLEENGILDNLPSGIKFMED